MKRSSASEAQVRAADPGQSTWLSANAGSGKTRVLIDRVARLLLGGTEPQKILCLTYTKAAASEMQNRLFQRLGSWAMLPEPDLRTALHELGVESRVDAHTLARARQLFARAIETPGGLKIQTIHSFCAALLKRFPLEARVSPDFAEMDDRMASLMRAEILEELAAGDDVAAVDAVAGLFSGGETERFLTELCRNSDGFSGDSDKTDILRQFGLPKDYGREDLVGEVFQGGEAALLSDLMTALRTSSHNDLKAAAKLSTVELSPPDLGTLSALESILLYGKGAKAGPFKAKIGAFPTQTLQKNAAAPLMPRLEDLMRRVEAGRAKRLALLAAEKTIALHRFAAAFLPRYGARKAARGWLDFDDLVSRAAALLSERSVASWVLFRLDGGIDHILVDEAQDTSPGQWKVIERLAEEFTAGEGARDQRRTIFVVGDKKQSIYSFQGADLNAFDYMKTHFAAKFEQVGARLWPMELMHSFRSSDAILRVVDLAFDERVNRGLGGVPKHVAFKSDLPGRVDLWPAIPKTGKPELEHWYDPTDILPEDHEMVLLARQIASEIRRMIDTGVQLDTGKEVRPIHAGDFLILVQRRSDLFHEIIRACKSANLDIAGADRLKIGGELAVKDLAALLSFLATPEDDLSLAAALRSPLFGWSEGQIFDLAHNRGDGVYLWTALRERAAEFPESLVVLNDLRDQADFLRPFDLLERMLTRHEGRRKLLARLGPEAEDGIDALLSQALAFEQAEIPSLTGFLVWMETDDVEIKRRLDSASKAIRVMTVHGAKGLEAPIVILPDTAKRREDVRDEVLRIDGRAVWKTGAEESPSAIAAEVAAMQDRQREERMRLLYVAMTRAESWLIICGAGDVGHGTDSWYSLVTEAMEKTGATTVLAEAGCERGPIRRVQHGSWPARAVTEELAPLSPSPLPEWASQRARLPSAGEAPLSPSGLGGAKALPSEAGLDDTAAKKRGTWLHLLLEHLPLWSEPEWPDVATSLLSSGDDPGTSDEIGSVLEEARRVLTAPDLRDLFASEALSEVEVTARLPELGNRIVHGTIDRLILSEERVLAVDFKSNAMVPAAARAVPDGILRQMGAYAAILSQIYPERRIETAILWTRTGHFMPLPPEIVREALQSTTIP